MAVITIWHNPRCSKSREALKLLQDKGLEITERRYLDEPPSLAELKALHAILGIPAIEMMRTKEPLFRELGLARDMDEADLLAAMAANPRLIERPVVMRNSRAVIARPPGRLEELF